MENVANFQRSSPLRKPIRPRRRPSRVTTSTPIANHVATGITSNAADDDDFLTLKSFHCTRMLVPSSMTVDDRKSSEDQRFFQCDRSLLLASCHYSGKGQDDPARNNGENSKKKVCGGEMRRHVTNVVAKALHLEALPVSANRRRVSYMRLY